MNNIDDKIEKAFIEKRSLIKFFESVYSRRIKRKISINLTWESTSSFNTFSGVLKISRENLKEFYQSAPDEFFGLLYSVLLHEIGHAIYTTGLKLFGSVPNVLEDMRLEYQISLWNARVKFKEMRYIMQDKVFEQHPEIKTKADIALILYRVVDNEKWIRKLVFSPESVDIIKDLLVLGGKYKRIDTEMFKYDYESKERKQLILLIQQIDKLLTKYIKLHNAEDESEKIEDEDIIEPTLNNPIKINEDSKKEEESVFLPQEIQKVQDNEPISKKELEQIKVNISKIKSEHLGLMDRINNDIPILENKWPNEEQYTRYNIGAFTTHRRKGIKGSNAVRRSTGRAKDLSMRRYSRRNFTTETKFFDRLEQQLGRGGKNSKVIFYLDRSFSMNGERTKVMVDYMKSFYDQMHKYIDIDIYVFDTRTYKIGRKELENRFIQRVCGNGTSPDLLPIKKDEEIVILTDGGWGCKVPEEYKRKAHFIFLDIAQHTLDNYFSDVKYKTVVDLEHLTEGFNRATRGLKKLLGE